MDEIFSIRWEIFPTKIYSVSVLGTMSLIPWTKKMSLIPNSVSRDRSERIKILYFLYLKEMHAVMQSLEWWSFRSEVTTFPLGIFGGKVVITVDDRVIMVSWSYQLVVMYKTICLMVLLKKKCLLPIAEIIRSQEDREKDITIAESAPP